jgi:peroxiredoxin Q/BCP
MFPDLGLPVMNHAVGAAGSKMSARAFSLISSSELNIGPRKATKGWQAMSMLEAGQPAPDFSLPGDSASKIRIKDFVGRKVVLYFYPKDDTSGCTQEAKDFSALKRDFEAAATDVVGVSADSAKSHDKFKAKHDLDVRLASDEDHGVLEAYGVWAEKSMYGRKYFGVERTTFLIDRKGRIARIWRKVKVPGHAAEVLEAAQNLD